MCVCVCVSMNVMMCLCVFPAAVCVFTAGVCDSVEALPRVPLMSEEEYSAM